MCIRDSLDEVLGQHALALQGPESFENDTDEHDRADDDRPHEWAAGPHDFPHGAGSYRRARRKGLLRAPPDKRVYLVARDGEHAHAARPYPEFDPAIASSVEDPGAGSSPVFESLCTGL